MQLECGAWIKLNDLSQYIKKERLPDQRAKCCYLEKIKSLSISPSNILFFCAAYHVRIQRVGGRRSGPTLESYKNIGFLSNTSPDPLKITKLQSK